jgi:hypothetical protein
MYGWSFAARLPEEWRALIRAMGRHRYVGEADLRLHFAVDRALAERGQSFEKAARAFDRLEGDNPELDLRSRDPRLWRSAEPEEVGEALEMFWRPDDAGDEARLALATALRVADLEPPEHEPFAGNVDEPGHPELILLDWVFFAVDELDIERHRGALRAMEDSGDEVDASERVYVEGPTLTEIELCRGCPSGVVPTDPIFWGDGPYRYLDYIFRGVARAAKLVEAPVGYRDVDEEESTD